MTEFPGIFIDPSFEFIRSIIAIFLYKIYCYLIIKFYLAKAREPDFPPLDEEHDEKSQGIICNI